MPMTMAADRITSQDALILGMISLVPNFFLACIWAFVVAPSVDNERIVAGVVLLILAGAGTTTSVAVLEPQWPNAALGIAAGLLGAVAGFLTIGSICLCLADARVITAGAGIPSAWAAAATTAGIGIGWYFVFEKRRSTLTLDWPKWGFTLGVLVGGTLGFITTFILMASTAAEGNSMAPLPGSRAAIVMLIAGLLAGGVVTGIAGAYLGVTAAVVVELVASGTSALPKRHQAGRLLSVLIAFLAVSEFTGCVTRTDSGPPEQSPVHASVPDPAGARDGKSGTQPRTANVQIRIDYRPEGVVAECTYPKPPTNPDEKAKLVLFLSLAGGVVLDESIASETPGNSNFSYDHHTPPVLAKFLEVKRKHAEGGEGQRVGWRVIAVPTSIKITFNEEGRYDTDKPESLEVNLSMLFDARKLDEWRWLGKRVQLSGAVGIYRENVVQNGPTTIDLTSFVKFSTPVTKVEFDATQQ